MYPCLLYTAILQNVCINHGDVANFDGAENQHHDDGDDSIDENAHSELGKFKREKLEIIC